MLIMTKDRHITTRIDPKKDYASFEEFQKTAPPNTLAVDGPVRDRTRIELSKYGVHGNVDHHECVDRNITLSACGQIRDFIKTKKIQKAFSKDGKLVIHTLIQKLDEDSVLCDYELKHPDLIENHNILLDNLITAEGKMDRFVGAYPIEKKILRSIGWIFEPYNEARFNGTLYLMDAASLESLLERIEGRIGKHIEGKGRLVDLRDGSYTILAEDLGWKVTKEKNKNARLVMYNELLEDGVNIVASIVREKDSKFIYTVRVVNDPFSVFDLNSFSLFMNKDEPGWGGGNYVAGPGINGSSAKPYQLANSLNEWMREQRQKYETEKDVKLPRDIYSRKD